LTLRLADLARGLESPVDVKSSRDGSGRLFAVEKAGRVRVIRDGALAAPPFLDISRRVGSTAPEQGLLGIAFHPDFGSPGAAGARLFYVNYTDASGDTVVAEFRVTGDPEVADPASERIVLTTDQPAANHNGGNLAFGPDGKLYIGLGDGGASGDKYRNAQNPASLLGKMLRIDPVASATGPYSVPVDNPFAGDATYRAEIWAYGLRNPWRYSFDRATGDLYIGDVGQGTWEEVDLQPAGSAGGQNYGWPILEGNHCYQGGTGCDGEGRTVRPIVEYSHDEGCSIPGGYVYRGSAIPALEGSYVFGDYCAGTIFAAFRSGGAWRRASLADTGLSISAFGEQDDGELLVIDYAGGAIYRLEAGPDLTAAPRG
jgi:glucose/arabinose dehydrogenase